MRWKILSMLLNILKEQKTNNKPHNIGVFLYVKLNIWIKKTVGKKLVIS